MGDVQSVCGIAMRISCCFCENRIKRHFQCRSCWFVASSRLTLISDFRSEDFSSFQLFPLHWQETKKKCQNLLIMSYLLFQKCRYHLCWLILTVNLTQNRITGEESFSEESSRIDWPVGIYWRCLNCHLI